MKLLEYQAKEIFSRHGIPIPLSEVATSPAMAIKIAERLGPVAIKAQVPVGGRGKSGGIKFAESPIKVEDVAEGLLGSKIKDIEIEKVLVEQKLEILDELYIGVVVDRGSKSYVILGSDEGGVDIEDVASKTPEKIVRQPVDPIKGLRDYHCRTFAKNLGYSGKQMTDLADIIFKLYTLAYEMDAELTEINPLALTCEGFVAADARLNIDNNALFRHQKLAEESRLVSQSELSPREREARALGLTYVELDGDIGIIGNGAGLTMATLDTVTLLGGEPANFLDLGGGASKDRIREAFSFVVQDPRVKTVFANILGGITRCDDTARGIVMARRQLRSDKPLVMRLVGTNEEEGRRILEEEGIPTLDTMEEAAEKAVALARHG